MPVDRVEIGGGAHTALPDAEPKDLWGWLFLSAYLASFAVAVVVAATIAIAMTACPLDGGARHIHVADTGGLHAAPRHSL